MKLESMKPKDIAEVEAILSPISKDKFLSRNLKRHLKNGLCRIMRDENDGSVVAFGMAISDGYSVSLSYYWVREDKRKMLASLVLFLGMFSQFKQMPVYINSEDISTFKEYVEPTKKKNEYRFIGFKEESIRQFQKLAKDKQWVQ